MAASLARDSLIGRFGLLIFLFLRPLSADQAAPSAFSFRRFDRDPAPVSLLGGSKVVNGGSAIELSGQAVYDSPIRIVQGNPQSLASFSTNFTFSMSDGGGGGEGFAFAMAPSNAPSNLSGNGRFGLPPEKNSKGFLVVEFEASNNRVVIDSAGSVKSRNVSSVNLVLNSGQELQCWIDYDADSRRLEVRLSKLSGSQPLDPFLAQSVDLWKMWNNKDVFFGLSSGSSSSQPCLIHTWSFKLRLFPHWIHSQPLDPSVLSKEHSEPLMVHHQKDDCFIKVMAAMIFGTGSGALGAFCLLYLWMIFGSRRAVAPEDLLGKEIPLGCEYKKVDVVVVDKEEAIEDGH